MLTLVDLNLMLARLADARPTPKAYLDTCIVSGLAKGDLAASELDALRRILEAHKRRDVALVTSEVTRVEHGRIPEQYRSLHAVIYNLLTDVPTCPTHRADSGLLLMGVGGGRREETLLTELKALLPDPIDAEHVFQAAKNDVEFFITTDRRTMVRYAAAVERLCCVKILVPTAFEKGMRATAPAHP